METNQLTKIKISKTKLGTSEARIRYRTILKLVFVGNIDIGPQRKMIIIK